VHQFEPFSGREADPEPAKGKPGDRWRNPERVLRGI